jgi:hypothetical protein
MIGTVDRPEWPHEILEFLTDSADDLLDEAGGANWLTVV